MKLVADAGPIIALAKIDRLAVLESLFEEIWLPTVVVHEVLAKPGPEARRIQQAIERVLRVREAPSKLPAPLELPAQGLDEGEKSVLGLAAMLAPPVAVLMDDAAGRAVARQAGIGVLGFAGVLLKARQNGLIERVVPLMLEARDRGYWLDDALIQTVRRLADE